MPDLQASFTTPPPRPAQPGATALLALLCLLALVAGCGQGAATDAGAPAEPTGPGAVAASGEQDPYVQEILAWRARREEGLRAEGGWLTVVGLHWLREGDSRVGSAPDLEIRLPGGPPLAGVLKLADGQVRLEPEPGAGLLLNGEPATPGPLRADADEGGPDVLSLGHLRLYLIRRGGQLGVRVKDLDNPARREFSGLEFFPVDPAWRIEGAWEPYPEPVVRQIPSAAGPPQEMIASGWVRFRAAGRELTLEPVTEEGEGGDLFFIFADATSGDETYGGGRFLYADPPREGRVVLDFNKAYNPPCVFTPYATCPLPRPENTLPVAVTAGEKVWGDHGR